MQRDSRGRTLSVGDIVAYNRSGDVIEGEVVHIVPASVHVRAHPDFQQGMDDSKTSRIRNASSILVLRRP